MKKVAMLGMYGGMWREYNPGCFLTGLKTFQELRERLPNANIDVFAIDNRLDTDHLISENKFKILDILFFSRKMQQEILENTLIQYDALILGGDIVWGGDDVVEDNDIFFLNSDKFLKRKSPIVLINSVHSFYVDLLTQSIREKIFQACERSKYISVRSQALKERLKVIGINNTIHYVPDPVLDFNLNGFKDFNLTEHCLLSNKKKIGISIREKLITDLARTLEQIDLKEYDVIFYPYSSQYSDLEGIKSLKRLFGNRFQYIEHYLNPIESFKIAKQFDVSITDKMHGITAAVIQNIPFISLDIEKEKTSRKDQLLESIGVDKTRNIRLEYDNPENVNTLINGLSSLLVSDMPNCDTPLMEARNLIRSHFDSMAKLIDAI